MSVREIEPALSYVFDRTRTNVYHAEAGQGIPRHEHSYRHATVCHAGAILIRKENIERVLRKGDKPALLKENEWHEIEALEPGTVFANTFLV